MYPDSSFKDMMENVAAGKSLTASDNENLNTQQMIFQKEDALFSQIPMFDNYDSKIKPQAKKLPACFSYSKLGGIAIADGKNEVVIIPLISTTLF